METNVSAVELFPIDDKTTLVEETLQAPNKYKYAEFAGFGGERCLKDIMRKILPSALYRTWEILAARQAPGNDCYLGIQKLAEFAMRTDRKLRMDLNELVGRRLLRIYSALKAFVQPDGSIHLRPVQIKDFTALYDLAHEYYVWMHSPDYIEPEREYMELVKADEQLYKKLRRFECYKRLLCNQVPGPKPQPKPIYAWYEDYETAVDGVETVQEQLKEANEQLKEPDRKLYLQTQLQTQLQKDSTERKEPSEKENNLSRVSFDSAPARREGDPLAPSASIAHVYTKNEPTPAPPLSPSSSLSPTNTTNPSETVQELGGAKLTSKQEKQAGKQTGRARRARRAKEQTDKQSEQAVIWKQAQQGRGKYQGDGKGQPAPNALVSSFAREVSILFNDQNVKASVTRLLRLVEGQELTQEQIVTCLVRAYWVAQETKKVLPQYQRPEGPIKMPLFCSMVGRFIEACVQGTLHYTREELYGAIERDERLILWATEQGFYDEMMHDQDTPVHETIEDTDERQPAMEIALEPKQDTAANDVTEEPPLPVVEEPELDEPHAYLPTENPEHGWTLRNAEHYADRLCEFLGGSAYWTYELQPTFCPDRYGFVLTDRATGEKWAYLTQEEIRETKQAYWNARRGSPFFPS